MSQVKFLGHRVLCVIDDNFDVFELKKSISKKAKNEIVLSRTGAMLNMAEIDFDRPGAVRMRKATIDLQHDCKRALEASRMRET